MQPIEPYQIRPVEFLPYDEQLPAVFALTSKIIATGLPKTVIEHIGSTAIPGTPGKNSLNIIIAVPLDQFDRCLASLEQLGFHQSPHQKHEPPTRPLRVGMVRHADKLHQVHIQLVDLNSEDHKVALYFRDYLIEHPDILAEYIAIKKTAYERSGGDAVQYNDMKQPFIRDVVSRRRN